MAKRLKRWNAYVAEAQRDPLEIELDAETVLTVNLPSSGAIRRLNRAQRAGDEEASLIALFGEKGAEKLWAQAEGAPPGALQELIRDVLREFGLTGEEPGEAPSAS